MTIFTMKWESGIQTAKAVCGFMIVVLYARSFAICWGHFHNSGETNRYFATCHTRATTTNSKKKRQIKASTSTEDRKFEFGLSLFVYALFHSIVPVSRFLNFVTCSACCALFLTYVYILYISLLQTKTEFTIVNGIIRMILCIYAHHETTFFSTKIQPNCGISQHKCVCVLFFKGKLFCSFPTFNKCQWMRIRFNHFNVCIKLFTHFNRQMELLTNNKKIGQLYSKKGQQRKNTRN